MLKKLMKYEYKATARFLLPAYGIFTLLLILQRLSVLAADLANNLPDSILAIWTNLFTVFIGGATILALYALVLCPTIYAIYRFWKNMIGDEGYLTHTLPVTAGQNISAKLLVTATWSIGGLLYTVLLGILYFLTTKSGRNSLHTFFAALPKAWDAGMSATDNWLLGVVIAILAAILAQLVYTILTAYSAMSLGQCVSRHKLLASAGAYVAYTTLVSLIIQVFFFAFSIGASIHAEEIDNFFFSNSTAGTAKFLTIFLLICTVFYAGLAVLHYFLSRRFLQKKLNLA